MAAFGPPDPRLGCWAEGHDRTDAFPAQPRNTWSNLSYVACALAVAEIWSSPRAALYLVAVSVLTVTSALYHAWPTSKARVGWMPLSTRQADHIGMYLTLSVIACTALGLDAWQAAAVAVASTGFAFVTDEVSPFAAVAIVVTVAALAWHGLAPLAVLGLAFLVGSYGAWMLDKHLGKRREEGRRVTIQLGDWGHAIWHVGSGVGLALLMGGAL